MFCLCVFTTLTNDTKQLNKKAREEREKNSQLTNFDTLNTPKKRHWTTQKTFFGRREERDEEEDSHTYYTTLITKYDGHDGR